MSTSQLRLKPGRRILSKPGKETPPRLTHKNGTLGQLPRVKQGAGVGVPVQGGKLHNGGFGQNLRVPRIGEGPTGPGEHKKS